MPLKIVVGTLFVILLAGAVFANQAPVVDTFTSSASAVLPGGTVALTVGANDPDCSGTCTSGCGQTIRSDLTQWSADGGSFTAIDNGTTASPYTATAQWVAPAIEGTYTITISLSDSGSFMCGGRQTTTDSLTILVTTSHNNPPVIQDLTAAESIITVDGTTTITCTASDPDGDPMTYAWSADLGVISGSGANVAYQASSTPGIVTITCTVTDDQGAFASDFITLSVTGILPQRLLRTGILEPKDLSSDDYGYLFVADTRLERIVVLHSSSGEVAETISVPGITSVAVDWNDDLLVGGTFGASVVDRQGNPLRTLSPGGALMRVTDAAVDRTAQRYGLLYGDAGKVVIFDSAGAVLFSFGSNGEGPGQFKGAASLTVAPDGSFYVSDTGHGRIHHYDPTGVYLESMGGRGSNYGEFNQVRGVAVDSGGVIYAVDAYQSRIQAFNADTELREIAGHYGDGLGELNLPGAVTIMRPFNKMAVASPGNGSIQLFALSGAVEPPSNTPPTTPEPLNPADGAAIPHGSSVILEADRAFDPDFQSLTITFELYHDKNGAWDPVHTWSRPEGTPTTVVDATPWATQADLYMWRVRAYDGTEPSAWSTERTFTVTSGQKNAPPEAPTPVSPVGDVEATDLQPLLTVKNAIDPDGDPLTYTFEVARLYGDATETIATSPSLPEGAGTTSWQIPGDLLEESQTILWRARAFDGYDYGPPSAYATFHTPPFDLPERGEYGNLPEGDRTRPDRILYRMGPQTADVPFYTQFYDVTAEGEVTIWINGADAGITVPALAGDAWSTTQEILLPAALLDGANPNTIAFIHAGFDPWGMREASLTPTPVPLLTATAFNTVVDIRWSSATQPDPGTLLRLYRSIYPDGPFDKVGDFTLTPLPIRDTNLTNGTTYYYLGAFVNLDGNEGVASNLISATPVADGGPTPITDLRVTRKGNDIVLTWTPVTSSPAVDGYEIYDDLFGLWNEDTVNFTNLMTTVDPFTGSYTVTDGALTGDDLWYSVVTRDVAGLRGLP